jgi:hypothetical protein
MTILYAKLDLGFADHPKIIGLSDIAFRALVESILYSRQHLTDGFIDARVVKAKGWFEAVDELTTNDLVNPSWTVTDGGFLIYGFADKQTTSGEIASMREQKSAAGKRSAEARKQHKSNTNKKSVQHNGNTLSTEGQPETETETETETHTLGASAMKADWKPSAELLAWAASKTPNVDIGYETERFINYWLSNGKRMKNWDATWRNWMLKNQKDIPPAQADRVRADEWMKAKNWRPES